MIPNEAIEAALIAYRAYVKEWQWSIDGSEDDAMRAALSAAAPLMAEIPEGWRLVPVNPDEILFAMLVAAPSKDQNRG